MFDPSFLQMQVYVAAIVEQGSFSRAAKVLRTSPSFVTRKIGNLEKTLGVKLFDRSTRKLLLTPAGNLLLPEIQTSLRHAERAWDLAHFYIRIWKDPLRIGSSPLISSNTLLRLHRLDLSELELGRIESSLEVPEPRAVVESAMNHKLVDLVLRGELHAGVGIMPIEDKGLWVEPLTKEAFCLCVPKNHSLAQRPSLAVRELHGEMPPRKIGFLFLLADAVEKPTIIEYPEIPDFPVSTVESHAGRLICGTLGGRRVVAMQGRLHRYEGYTLQQVTFPVRVLRALGRAGVRVAIDDFGTGYSSLAYLTRFPLASLKIDRSFVADVLDDEADATIVRTIVEMAHTLGFTVIAEGVERDSQAAFLRALGCEQAQGFLFARPMSAEEFSSLIAASLGAAAGTRRRIALRARRKP